MHLNNYENRHDLLIDWILEEMPAGSSFLDIGANDGTFCPEVRRIAEHAGSFEGVDPDVTKLERHPLLDKRYPAMLEDADIPAASVDCAYAIYVFEHVEHAERFLEAAGRIIKPGGSLFFITPNSYHYFARIAGLFATLGIQGAVLRMIRPSQLVDRYHYPALYRLNHPKKLTRMAARYGFDECEYRFSERLDEFACYFPGPLKALPAAWQRMVERSGREHLLGNLMGRMVRASD